jgi:hypothetical protein
MPPAAAARRSGRRIRADLLRRGGLRAVIALPAGVAPPFGIPLHLWILRRPGKGQPQSQKLLLVDIGALPETRDRERPSWQMLRTAVLEAWTAFDRDGTVPERPGVSRALPVIDLLDDDVDLTPARHLPQQAVDGGATGLAEVRARLTDAVRRTAELTPLTEGRGASARRTLTSVGELARAGALLIRTGGGTGLGQGLGTGGGQGLGTGGGQGLGTGRGGTVRPAVLTEHDVIGGGPATGVLPGVSGADTDAEADTEPAVLVEIGDVVVPVLGRGAVARVIDETHAGAVLGRNVQLLRPDPGALDPWFLAGFLRGTVNNRQASSFTSTATRLDVRRLQLPRLPLAEQQRYGRRFHDLAAFEDALRLTARLGEQLVQGLYDGLTDGSVGPE